MKIQRLLFVLCFFLLNNVSFSTSVTPPELNSESLIVCADGNDIVEIIPKNLSYLITSDSNVAISYYLTEEDAKNKTNEIDPTKPYKTKSIILYVRGTDKTTGEFAFARIEIISQASPKIDDIKRNQSSENKTFDLDNIRKEIKNVDPSIERVSFYESKEDAWNEQKPLPNLYMIEQSKTIYVNATNDFSCFLIKEIQLNLIEFPVCVSIVYEVDGDENGIATIDLKEIAPLVTNSENAEVTFYENAEDAKNGTNSLPTTYSAKSKIIFGRIQVKETNIYIVCPVEFIVTKKENDNDKDGIFNENDECPDVFGWSFLQGCPLEQKNFTIKTMNVSCFGNKDGKIVIQSANSKIEFDYELIRNNQSVSKGELNKANESLEISDLLTGTYTLKITQNEAEQFYQNFILQIQEPTKPTFQ